MKFSIALNVSLRKCIFFQLVEGAGRTIILFSAMLFQSLHTSVELSNRTLQVRISMQFTGDIASAGLPDK